MGIPLPALPFKPDTPHLTTPHPCGCHTHRNQTQARVVSLFLCFVPPPSRVASLGGGGARVARANDFPITENGRNSRNVPFKTESQLSDGNIILCIQIAQIPLYFGLQGCISFK